MLQRAMSANLSNPSPSVCLNLFGKRKTGKSLRVDQNFRTRIRLCLVFNRTTYISRTTGSSVARMSSQSDCNGDAGFNSTAPDYAEIIVVRHGETIWNVNARIQGHLDVELNEVGRQQAAAVADRLSKESKISAVYSSDLKRALETAQIIASSCGAPEVMIGSKFWKNISFGNDQNMVREDCWPEKMIRKTIVLGSATRRKGRIAGDEKVIQDPDLRERNLGDLQGIVFHEAVKLNTEAYQAFLSPRTDQEIPGGGESLDQLYLRCASSLQRIGRKHKGERVVVVTHGGVLRALYKRAAPNGQHQGKILNTSVNIFHLSDGEEWIIKTWGDVSHLTGTGFLETGFGGDRTSG
ncbi:hypothetical protein HHK36_002532 [Tetracentron sinense]|uniref:Phosphoglycerate mutase n=1 Tax=Tetracentron sinense TaxID=13715 RepID=A0A835DRP0_TETSI|nr:hypothetical protein HHK36_002532 [Tetracentron sinense]